MATTFVTPTIVAKEALICLENNMVFGNLVHRAYTTEFKRVGDTILVRKPAEFTAANSLTAGGSVTEQTVAESSISVVLDKLYDITFPITSHELSLDIVSFKEQCIAPAMRRHAQNIDALLAAEATAIASHSSVSATPNIVDIAAVRAQLNLNKVPFDNRSVVLHPQTEEAYIVQDAFLHAEKRGDTQAIKEAHMGRVFGMDFYMDQNIATHSCDSSAGTGTLSKTEAAGSTTVQIQGNCCHGIATAASITFAVGDVFKIQGELLDKGHRVGAAVTAGSASTATITTVDPAIQVGGVASGKTVTFQLSHKNNLALHKNAIALVTAPLEPPLGGARGDVVSYKGLSCRVVYGYEQRVKTNLVSIDILFGIKTLDKELACRLCDAR